MIARRISLALLATTTLAYVPARAQAQPAGLKLAQSQHEIMGVQVQETTPWSIA